MAHGHGPKDIFGLEQLHEWKKIFQKNSITKTSNGDDCWGIDPKCLSYNWYRKVVMPTFSEFFGKELKLIFASYIDCYKTFPIHRDIKPLPEGKTGKHAVSILVPFSLDYKFEGFDKVSTDIFDDEKQLIESLTWKQNSFVWWDSDVNHASSDYMSKGIHTKQYFITHTYV